MHVKLSLEKQSRLSFGGPVVEPVCRAVLSRVQRRGPYPMYEGNVVYIEEQQKVIQSMRQQKGKKTGGSYPLRVAHEPQPRKTRYSQVCF